MARARPSTLLARNAHPRGAYAFRVLRASAAALLPHVGGGELSLLLVTDRAVRVLNRDYRGKDKATDVLSFPQDAPGGLLGDVVISLDTAKRQAAERGLALSDELVRLLVHGVCHLRGFDHETGDADARRMAKEERRLLGRLGFEVRGMVDDALDRPATLDARRKRRKSP